MTKNKAASPAVGPSRFAHPFFTHTPIQKRPVHPRYGNRLLQHIQGNLQAVPAPTRAPAMTLDEIIGAQGAKDIQAAQMMRFHAAGDTGKGANTPQSDVANAMTSDFDISNPAQSPAFFYHLGDVIYGPNKDQRFRPEFYEPYVHYPGKIVGIPGNHDGEVFPSTDPQTLRAFLANFCAPGQTVPPIAGTILRETMNQPGVYWLLDAPFVQIVGMYSNAAENPGFISGTIPGPAQKAWLVQTLQTIGAQRKGKTRKALVFATHHPPFTAGGHAPGTDMLADIDGACKQAGVMPDLFLSGHAHSYQRYTRNLNFGGKALEIPYLVAGTGGINDQAVPAATGQVTGDHTFKKSRQGYGYLLIEVTKDTLTAKMMSVNGQEKAQFDQVTVDLASNSITLG
jgi:hypothetical protein